MKNISDRKKAIIIVDVQESFLDYRNEYIVANIIRLLDSFQYDLYVEATFHTEKGSLWDIQQQWICPEGGKTKTISTLSVRLRRFKPIQVHKETKSAFKGDVDILKIFKENGIKEVHVVGLDTNDCVLATAYESFDFGFVTYVIEDCCQSSSNDELHKYALELLGRQNMTDRSDI